MAPIRVKWDPEILAGGFRPSSIFDEAEVSTTTAPVDVVGVQSAAAAVNPAHNLSTGVNALVEGFVDRVVALATNTTASTTMAPVMSSVGVTNISTTASPARNISVGIHKIVAETVRRVVDLNNHSTTSTPATSLTTPSWTTTTPNTILRRAVEKVATRPEVAVEHVRFIFVIIIIEL